MTSLQRTGSRLAWQTAASASQDPPKYLASVSTERADAPPASYAAAVATGSARERIGPAEGEAPLISAIRASPLPDSARRTRAAGPGRSTATAAGDRMALRAATSARLWATISSRIISVLQACHREARRAGAIRRRERRRRVAIS